MRPYGLTAREQETVKMLAAGFAPKEIAAHFGIGATSVKNYVMWARQKMDCHTTYALIARWNREQGSAAAYERGLHDGLRIREQEQRSA